MFDTGQIGDSTTGPHGIKRGTRMQDLGRAAYIYSKHRVDRGDPNPKSCQL